jgi:hypothetical protein
LKAGVTTLVCKKNNVAKFKEVKTGLSNSEKSGRTFLGRLWLKKGCFDDDDDDAQYRITKSFKRYMGYIENPFMTSYKAGFVIGQYDIPRPKMWKEADVALF